jgi:CO/xanthine dehydrogenase FAD-binding subunit
MPALPREFHRPTTLAAALDLLRRRAPRTQALMPGPRLPDEPFAGLEAAVDLSALGLDAATQEADGSLRLGALLTLQSLAIHPAATALADGLLARAAQLAGGNAQRQAATLGGAVRQHLGAASGVTRDGPPETALALLALDARLIVHGAAGERAMPLSDYYDTGGMLAMDELLVAVSVPAQPAGARGALERVARTPRDQAIVAAACVRAPGLLRLAVAGATPRPVRLPAIEAELSGRELTAEALAGVAARVEALMDPRDDFRASAEYRRAMAGTAARRVLQQMTT